MLRRLHHIQPETFAFTPANLAWAKGQISKFPEGRQASAVIPILWRAQEQEGWVTQPALEHIADMLGMAYIRVLEVATFYFMFQLQPVGSVAHIQVCGTLSCMICGAEDLIGICKDRIADHAHDISADGKFSWEEVECLGACTNAPMVQIGKDFYEDLSAETFNKILDELSAGNVPTPGPQNGRYSCEPLGGAIALSEYEPGKTPLNVSATLATEIGDTVKRIDGTEVPLLTPWLESAKAKKPAKVAAKKPAAEKPTAQKAQAKPAEPQAVVEVAPEILKAARKGGADDLKLIKGVGPKLEGVLNDLGFYHFDQIEKWTDEQIAWVDSRLQFKGRIERDDWTGQAKILAQGGETAFSEKANK